MKFHEHALRVSQIGGATPLCVFPLVEGQKTPAVSDWQQGATCDPLTIRQIGNADMGGPFVHSYNVGLRTGQYGDRYLIAIDVDNKNEKRGSESIVALELQGVEFPATYTQDTPTGGEHRLYWSRVPVRNLADRDGKGSIGRGIDVRGVGGYVVGSGSVTDKGTYTDNGAPIAEAPAALIERILQSGGAPIERSASTEMPAISTRPVRQNARSTTCATRRRKPSTAAAATPPRSRSPRS